MLPPTIDLYEGAEYTFQVQEGKAPTNTDLFILEKGVLHLFPILGVSTDSFTVKFTDIPPSDTYIVSIKRGDKRKQFGNVFINTVSKIPGFEPDKKTNLYGVVTANGEGVPNVVVSDGIDVTITDKKGIYQLASTKRLGYVFVSIPSGYEAPSVGVLPTIHHKVRGDINTLERVDLVLINSVKVRTILHFSLSVICTWLTAAGDLEQFKAFTKMYPIWSSLRR